MRRVVAFWLLVALPLGCDGPGSTSQTPPNQQGMAVTPRVTLHVAVFPYLPDAGTALERMEEAFAKAEPDIDLVLEMWDPYSDDVGDRGLKLIEPAGDKAGRFDIAEIDLCRLDELMGGAFGGLDPLPVECVGRPEQYVGPAAAALRTDQRKYVLPHWVCAALLTYWADNKAVDEARSFADLMKALDPASGRMLLADLAGTSGLGEIYADAVLDKWGPDEARKHLEVLSIAPADAKNLLKKEAREAVLALVGELRQEDRDNLKYFHKLNDHYPRDFAANRGAVLYGYSERLYFAEREMQFRPKKKIKVPEIEASDVKVRPFSFADTSQGTPAWVDGFIVPKGRLDPKRQAILKFLKFVQSNDGYAAFVQPNPDRPASYLLPAVVAAYDGPLKEKEPALLAYRAAMDESLPLIHTKLWRGVERAGMELKKELFPTP